jgi:hypothetical protein
MGHLQRFDLRSDPAVELLIASLIERERSKKWMSYGLGHLGCCVKLGTSWEDIEQMWGELFSKELQAKRARLWMRAGMRALGDLLRDRVQNGGASGPPLYPIHPRLFKGGL